MIHLHRTENGQFLVRYRGDNGKILAPSETVKSRRSAFKNMFAMHDMLRKAAGLRAKPSVTLTFLDHTRKKAPATATCHRCKK